MTEITHKVLMRAHFNLASRVSTTGLINWLKALPEDHELTYYGNANPPCFEATWERDLVEIKEKE